MPDYTIIAGPNGAGKSTFSARLSEPGTLVFDADKVKAIKEKQWPDIPVESIEIMLTTAYWDIEEIAIEKNKSLTIETNLRDDFLIKRASYFKEKGYSVNLIFMLLPDIKASIDRVNSRVDQKGHFVDVDSIKYNFEHSLRVFKQHFNKFDTVFLFDASAHSDLSIPTTLLRLDNHQISYINPNAPTWAKPHIDHIVQNTTTN